MGRAFPYSLMPAPSAGITSYADWAALPSSATDGDLAHTEDDGRYWEWREVSGDGFWLPAEVTRGASVAYRSDAAANLCRLRLSDASIPAAWLTAGATKSAGNPLSLAAGLGLNWAAAEMSSSAGGLYLLRVVPTSLGVGVAYIAYQSGSTNLLPGAYITPSNAVVGNLWGAHSNAGGDQAPTAGRPIFVLHDDRGATRLTRVMVPGYGITYESAAPRSTLATSTPSYFGATNLSAAIVQIDYIGALSIS